MKILKSKRHKPQKHLKHDLYLFSGASEMSFSRYETSKLAHRHRDQFGYTGKTVSEPYDQQSMDAKWQDNYPGRPRQWLRTTSVDDGWPRYNTDVSAYDSRSNTSTVSMYHHRLYGGRDFTGAGFMSQSIEKSLNGLPQSSSHSLYYDGRRWCEQAQLLNCHYAKCQLSTRQLSPC